MNSRNKLAEMPIRPLLYTMAVPLMLSLLVQSLYNIVEQYLSSNRNCYGQIAGAIAEPLYKILSLPIGILIP